MEDGPACPPPLGEDVPDGLLHHVLGQLVVQGTGAGRLPSTRGPFLGAQGSILSPGTEKLFYF